MSDFNSLYQPGLYLSPDQEDALLAALSSNNPTDQSTKQELQKKIGPDSKIPRESLDQSPQMQAPGSGHLEFGTEQSPFLDYFDPDVDFDAEDADLLIGDLPDMPSRGDAESRDKRKSMDGNGEDDEGGKKRRESEFAKKPGRKPLMAEPTSKRKAQNRAAQRAFRERKEKHLKDLETKVEDLEKESEDANHENSILRSQVQRLQVELREYRKRLSWMSSGNGISPSLGSLANGSNSRTQSGLNNNDFNFEFPKFGDLPGAHIFNNGSLAGTRNNNKPERSQASPNSATDYRNPKPIGPSSTETGQTPQSNNFGSGTNSPLTTGKPYDELTGRKQRGNNALNADNLNGFLGNSSHTTFSSPRNPAAQPADTTGADKTNNSGFRSHGHGTSTVSNTDSPSASSESHQTHVSSMGTSPEPSLNSPSTGKQNELGLNTINEEKAGRGSIEGEKSFCDRLGEACGNIKNPVPVSMTTNNNGDVRAPGPNNNPGNDFDGFDLFSQQNGGQFDPVLFGEYRDTQDAILSQDFGTFFDDAFPLPDLGSPFNDPQVGKKDPLIKPDEDEEVVPADDKSQMMTCTKIWDRLQSMDKFRNGEIDVDNLCTELRTKARCSEGGVVVDQKDVDDIMGRAH